MINYNFLLNNICLPFLFTLCVLFSWFVQLLRTSISSCRKFEDIFDVDHFINYLKDDVRIVRDIPDWFTEKDELFTSIKLVASFLPIHCVLTVIYWLISLLLEVTHRIDTDIDGTTFLSSIKALWLLVRIITPQPHEPEGQPDWNLLLDLHCSLLFLQELLSLHKVDAARDCVCNSPLKFCMFVVTGALWKMSQSMHRHNFILTMCFQGSRRKR